MGSRRVWRKNYKKNDGESEEGNAYLSLLNKCFSPVCRVERSFHAFVKRIVDHKIFNSVIMLTILGNAVSLALENVRALKGRSFFFYLDEFYLFIYTVEFLLKFYAERLEYFVLKRRHNMDKVAPGNGNSKDGSRIQWYNIFDFLLLITAYVPIVIAFTKDVSTFKSGSKTIQTLRILRTLRALRALRTIGFVRGLQTLVRALMGTMFSVANVFLLLLLIMFLFAILGYYLFGWGGDGEKENWGDLFKALLTLFAYVTADGWVDLQVKLDEYNKTGSRLFTVFFIFIGHFIFTNILIGFIITNINDATEAMEHEIQIERQNLVRYKKDFMMRRQQQDIKCFMEKQQQGEYKNFRELLGDFERTLRHDDIMVLTDPCTNIRWLDTYINTLDHLDQNTMQIQQFLFEQHNLMSDIIRAKNLSSAT